MMQNLYNEMTELLLKQAPDFFANDRLNKNKVSDAAYSYDSSLLKVLLNNGSLKKQFFVEVEKTQVFKQREFLMFINNKSFLNDSYTRFKNEIGLQDEDGRYFRENKDVVLIWPHKDCVLEGGQTKDDQKQFEEVFYNESLAPDEIDRLKDTKALTSFVYYDVDGKKELNSKTDIRLNEQNLLIKGNNLLALCSLSNQKKFRGTFKAIVTDPPYNSELDSFTYNDKFKKSTWLTFLKNRLEIAKELLAKDGAIFISIDDRMMFHLKVLCDEVFGSENFIANMVWLAGKKSIADYIAVNHEYCLVYAKNKKFMDNSRNDDGSKKYQWRQRKRGLEKVYSQYDKLKIKYKDDFVSISNGIKDFFKTLDVGDDAYSHKHYCEVDTKGLYFPGDIAQGTGKGGKFDILHPKTKKPCKLPGGGWRFGEDNLPDLLKNELIHFGIDHTTVPCLKRYLKETEREVPPSVFYKDGRGASKEVNTKFTDEDFEFPHPKDAFEISRFIDFATNEGDWVLDFFSGSGTTVTCAHKMKRRWIGIEQLDEHVKTSLTRLERAIKGEKDDITEEVGWQGGGSFLYCEIKEHNQQYVHQIQKAKKPKELWSIWQAMKQDAFLRIEVDKEKFTEKAFNEMSIADQQVILLKTLDKNHLYVNLSEMADEEHKMLPDEIALNKKFYNI